MKGLIRLENCQIIWLINRRGLEGFLDDFYKEIKEDVKKHTRKSLWLLLSVMISDFVETLSLFKIFCHVFHSKRGFNVLDRCRYWARVFVDSARTSCVIQKSLSFKKSELNSEISKTCLLSEIVTLNVNYVSVVCSIIKAIVLADTLNFGVIHYGSICSSMSPYMFYLEVYLRVFINLMKRHTLKIIIEYLRDNRNADSFRKDYSHQFLSRASYQARNLVTYLNLSISVHDFNYIFHNVTKKDVSSFLRIMNDKET